MLNGGGRATGRNRGDADLYVYADPDELYSRLKPDVEIVADVNDTFYGSREFTIRDINGFWITFGNGEARPGAREPLIVIGRAAGSPGTRAERG